MSQRTYRDRPVHLARIGLWRSWSRPLSALLVAVLTVGASLAVPATVNTPTAGAAGPTNLYVSWTGDGDCLTPSTPCSDFSKAMNHLGDSGNIINVAGTFSIDDSFAGDDSSADNPLTIRQWPGNFRAYSTRDDIRVEIDQVVTFDGISFLQGLHTGVISNDGGTLTIANSYFANGQVDTALDQYSGLGAGAIVNVSGTLAITGSSFFNNTTAVTVGSDTPVAGAIVNFGTATIANSSFINNTAAVTDNPSTWVGGAIVNTGTATITSSTFSGNGLPL